MRTILLLISMIAISNVYAQQQLASDQNPNYMLSQQKYMQVKDSLLFTMNTTEQNTYKAYDWYEAKMERKQNRINTRQQVRINRSLRPIINNGWNDGWNNNWNNNGWNNNGWNNGWNRNRWNNSRFFPGTIGYRTGNWWFWF
jgi:hypothetical protein